MTFKLIQSNQHFSEVAGLPLIGQLINPERLETKLTPTHLKPLGKKDRHIQQVRIRHSDVLIAYLGLLTQGKNDFEHIKAYEEDDFFALSLGIQHIPSAETLRQRMDMAPAWWRDLIEEENLRLLQRQQVELTPCLRSLVPLDIDVSPFDNSCTKKEGVSRTYKGMDGYAPIFGYLGKSEGYAVKGELREGKQHSQCDKGEFVRGAIESALQVTPHLLVRMDSGHDGQDTLKICDNLGVEYVIKRNLRREDRSEYLRKAHSGIGTKWDSPREGKIVYRWKEEVPPPSGFTRPLYMVCEVIERYWDASDGQYFLELDTDGAIEVSCYWTSLPDDADVVIRLYEEHGTSEQFHSELKSDMDLERFPSGKFETNALILQLGLYAYNLLKVLGQNGLRSGLYPLRKVGKRLRIKTVIQTLISMACKLVNHARQRWLVFGRNNKYYPLFQTLYGSLSP